MSELRARKGPRTILGLLAALGLVAAMATPVAASDTVPLHGPHKGTDSSEAGSFEEKDCGPFGNAGSGVVWHFILNNLDSGTATAAAEFEYTDAGAVNVNASNDGQTQHIWVLTPDDDVLEDGFATVDDQSGDKTANLVLSHICHQEGGPSESEPAESQPAESEPAESQPAESEPAESQPVEESEEPEESIREGELGGTPTPAPSAGELPDTAFGDFGTTPATVLSLVLIAALAGMVYVRLARQR